MNIDFLLGVSVTVFVGALVLLLRWLGQSARTEEEVVSSCEELIDSHVMAGEFDPGPSPSLAEYFETPHDGPADSNTKFESLTALLAPMLQPSLPDVAEAWTAMSVGGKPSGVGYLAQEVQEPTSAYSPTTAASFRQKVTKKVAKKATKKKPVSKKGTTNASAKPARTSRTRK